MVSLFKKPALENRGAERASPKWERTAYQAPQVAGHSGQERHARSAQSMSRPGTSSSNHAPGAASFSTTIFHDPGPPSSALPKMPDTHRPEEYNPQPVRPLKTSRSNPTIGLRRTIGPSSGVRSRTLPGPRPTTAGGEKTLAQPMEACFEAEPMPRQAVISYSRGDYLDDEAAIPPPLVTHRPQAPNTEEPQNPAYPPTIPPRSTRRKIPSPPASVAASDDTDKQSFVESPIVPYAFRDMSPSGNGALKGIPSALVPGGLRQLMDDDYMAYEPTGSLPILPFSAPTPPPSLPTASGENSSRPSLSDYDDTVIIQTVGAMKGTTTKNASIRRSVEPSVEAERKEIESAHPGEQQAPMFQGLRGNMDHRPVLKVDTQPTSRSTTPDRAAPLNAPFSKPSRSASPFGGSPLNPARSGVPAGAVGARGRPLRPVITVPQRVIPEGIPVNIRPVSMDSCESDDDEPGSPEEPDSPLLPLTGPLASPMTLPPPPESPARPPISRNGSDRDYSVTTNFKGVSQIPNRSATMPEVYSKPAATEKVTWPFLSSSNAIPEPSSAAPPLRTMTPPVRTQSPYSIPETSSMAPPMHIVSPPVRSQSPLHSTECAAMPPPLRTMTPPVRTQSPLSIPEPSSSAPPLRTMTPPVRTQSPYSTSETSSMAPPMHIMSPPVRSQSPLHNTEFAAMPPPVRSQSPFSTAEPSSLRTPARTQSPVFVPSFSRPYTPTNTNLGMPSQQQNFPNNTQTPVSNNTRLRGPSAVRRGGGPPPRRTPDFGPGRPMPEAPGRSGSTFI